MNIERMIAALLILVALATAACAVSFASGTPACYMSYPFLLGGEISGPPALGWGPGTWAFGSPCDVASLPVYFNAHGYGFPMTIGNMRIAFIPSIC